MDCLVLIPTYNEADNVEAIARAVLAQGPRFGVLIIDDNSPDGTGRIADEMAAAEKRIMVFHRPQKQGLGPAYIAGFGFALAKTKAQYFCTMDADFSHNPADLLRLLAAGEAGADMAVGSRYCRGGGVENWGLLRLFISRGGGLYARALLGSGISHDPTGGFNLYTRRVLETIDLKAIKSNGYGFQIETKHRVSRAGFKLVDVPITFTDRRMGQSKMSFRITVEAFWRVLIMAARIK